MMEPVIIIREAEEAAVAALTDAKDAQVAAFYQAESVILDSLAENEIQSRDLLNTIVEKEINDLPEVEREVIFSSSHEFIKFMAELINLKPEEVTNSEVRSGLATLAQVKAAREKLRQAQVLIQQATRLVVGITVKVAGLAVL